MDPKFSPAFQLDPILIILIRIPLLCLQILNNDFKCLPHLQLRIVPIDPKNKKGSWRNISSNHPFYIFKTRLLTLFRREQFEIKFVKLSL
jgi:hypothetical protein